MKKTAYEKFFKRFFDFCISLFVFIVISPIFLVLMLVTRICNGKGVFFKQHRPGKNGKLFVLLKFRSMNNKKDEDGNLLPDAQRVTKWGKFLRKSSLDELPQLLNIIKGEMSIVGPRPRLVKDMVFYDKEYFDSYSVRPGLTGQTQANGRNANTWEQVLEADKEYRQKITLGKDLKIIFQTIKSIFVSTGSADGSCDNKQAYYYADYLLESNQITLETYNAGLQKAQDIISEMGVVEFSPELAKITPNNIIELESITSETAEIKTIEDEVLQVNNIA